MPKFKLTQSAIDPLPCTARGNIFPALIEGHTKLLVENVMVRTGSLIFVKLL
jgi:hypothetical protein